jgi:hypothetical protein
MAKPRQLKIRGARKRNHGNRRAQMAKSRQQKILDWLGSLPKQVRDWLKSLPKQVRDWLKSWLKAVVNWLIPGLLPSESCHIVCDIDLEPVTSLTTELDKFDKLNKFQKLEKSSALASALQKCFDGTPPREAKIALTKEAKNGKGEEWQLVDKENKPSVAYLLQMKQRLIFWHYIIVSDMRADRFYQSTPLPTLPAVRPKLSTRSQDVLQMLYGEVCKAWGQLTDVRFKLLALVPAVSIFVVANLFASEVTKEMDSSGKVINVIERPFLSPPIQAGIALAGLITVSALYLYEKRNSQLYDDLISRGRKIEKEMGIGTGIFLGRLKSSKKWLWIIPIQHDWAINAIYWITMGAWLITFLKTLDALGWINLSMLWKVVLSMLNV